MEISVTAVENITPVGLILVPDISSIVRLPFSQFPGNTQLTKSRVSPSPTRERRRCTTADMASRRTWGFFPVGDVYASRTMFG